MLDWILSLAENYSPDQAMMVLIDTRGKLMEYGGQHKLSDLPHVAAAVSEIEELEGLIANLMAEGAWMVAPDTHPGQRGRELFVFIDNFDDFSDEIESQRALLESLSRLLRRYGQAGLHFVVAFTPEASTSDLRRRVLSSNYGLGLQTAQAVDVLKVSRIPAGVRDKSLPVGRGYLVKSGQPVLIQVASPYEGMVDNAGLSAWRADNDLEWEAARVAQALDAWVERIKVRYGNAKAAWSGGATVAEPVRTGQPSARANQMLRLVQRALRVEAQQASTTGGTATMMTGLLAIDIAQWQDEATLVALMKGLWRKRLMEDGISEMFADQFIGDTDETSLLWEVERLLISAEEELQARQLAAAEQVAGAETLASEAAQLEPGTALIEKEVEQ